MYESFYGFTEKPFSLFPDQRFLFLNRRYKLALSLLEFGVLNKNGMILLTGDPGMGKTTLLQKILSEVDESMVVGNVTFTHDAGTSLLPWVLKSFNLSASSEQPADMYQVLLDFFSHAHRQEKGVLLIIDEAQNLSVEKLEELRLLYNINDREGPVLQILLAGHSQLRDQLSAPQLSAFVQRIGTDFSLEPLSEEDTMAYVRHRVLTVGGSASLFSDKACDIVYRCSKGTPRLINQLCDTSLIYGFSERANRITETLVADVAKDRQLSGIFSSIEDSPSVKQDTYKPDKDQRVDRQQDLTQQMGFAVSPIARHRDEQSEEQDHSAVLDNTMRHTIDHVKPHPQVAPIERVPNLEKYWEQGLQLRDDGWHLEAIQSFKRAATHHQYQMSGWFQVGQCYLVLGRNSEALNAFRTSLENPSGSDRELAAIQYSMGQVLEDIGELEESQHYYHLAALTDPTFEIEQRHAPTATVWGDTFSAIIQRASTMPWVERLYDRFFPR